MLCSLPNEILIMILKKLRYREALKICKLNSQLYNLFFAEVDRLFYNLFNTESYKIEINDEIMIAIPGPLICAFVDNTCDKNGLYHYHFYKSNLDDGEFDFVNNRDIRKVVREGASEIGFFIRDFDKLLYIDGENVHNYVIRWNDDENRLHKYDLGTIDVKAKRHFDKWGHWNDYNFDLYTVYKIHKNKIKQFSERF